MSPRPAVQEDRESPRERILEVFAERARVRGPRSVVMAELARDLGMSTRTLYQHFGSKAEIVHEIVARWASDMDGQQRRRMAGGEPAAERVIAAATDWIGGQDRFSDAFWEQLVHDFPDASRVLAEQIGRSVAAARETFGPDLREGLAPELAFSLLKSVIRHALDPKRCDRLGLSRPEAVRQAVELWCRGALRPDARV